MVTSPQIVQIGPYAYRVIVEKELRTDRGEDLFGEILHEEQVIRVKEGLSPERFLTVLIHEILHGVDELACVGLSEKQVLRIAPMLTHALLACGLLAPNS